MWLFTSFGFFSIVQKPGDPHLTVRARTAQDLDALRQRIPILGPTLKGAGTDYPYRARLSKEAFGIGLARIAGDIDYSNFKTEVGRRQSMARAFAYHDIWNKLWELERLDGRESHEYRLVRRDGVDLSE